MPVAATTRRQRQLAVARNAWMDIQSADLSQNPPPGPPGPPPEPVRSDVKWCPCPGNGARSEIDDSLCSEIGGQAYEDADGKKFCAVVPPGVFAPLPAGSKRLNR